MVYELLADDKIVGLYVTLEEATDAMTKHSEQQEELETIYKIKQYEGDLH